MRPPMKIHLYELRTWIIRPHHRLLKGLIDKATVYGDISSPSIASYALLYKYYCGGTETLARSLDNCL